MVELLDPLWRVDVFGGKNIQAIRKPWPNLIPDRWRSLLKTFEFRVTWTHFTDHPKRSRFHGLVIARSLFFFKYPSRERSHIPTWKRKTSSNKNAFWQGIWIILTLEETTVASRIFTDVVVSSVMALRNGEAVRSFLKSFGWRGIFLKWSLKPPTQLVHQLN